nr:HEAT repeat containing protein 2 [Hymenolepis microstoma]
MGFTLSESSRAINLLRSDSKIKRKESLTAIEQDVCDNLSLADINDIKKYCSWIIPPLVSLISDPVESHRDRVLGILSTLCKHVEESSCFIPHVTQALVKRFTVDSSYEESEEIRLNSLKLLLAILEKIQSASSCFDDYCIILQKSLEDSFHEVKVTCCRILCVLAKKFSSLFYHSAEPLLNTLLRNIVHQQHKVRFATIEAIGVVFMHCNGKFVDITITPLTQRLFDPSISVRKAVVQVTGEWLLNLPDRYSYHTKLIPLILSGQMDECNEIREEALAIWHDVGLKFQKENENDLKDKIDFDPGPPSHYPADQLRPNLGCRQLINRSASRLLPGLCNDLRDWQEATRYKAAGLLPIILLHLESAVTQHTQTLITGLCNGVAEIILRASLNSSLHLILMSPQRGLPSLSSLSSPKKTRSYGVHTEALSGGAAEAFNVLLQLFAAARYVSCFVKPHIWWKMLNENSRRCLESTSPASLAANYFILANLLAGSSLDLLITCSDSEVNLCPLLRITAYLTSDEQISCAAFTSRAGLLECANVLIALLEEIVNRVMKNCVPRGDSDEDVLKQIAEKLLEDTFFLLMAISAGWNEELERMDSVVEFNDQVGRLLCQLSQIQYALLKDSALEVKSCPGTEISEEALVTEAKKAGQILERLYGYQLPKILRRLDTSRKVKGRGWHAKSTDLSIFIHAVLAAGPGLLLGLEPHNCACNVNGMDKVSFQVDFNDSPLMLTLRLLEEGCRLGEPLDTTKDGAGASTNPLSLAAEAELHLRGLLLLMRLTEHARVRVIMTQPRLFRYCLERLVLPSCLWRAGRTAEAMRKAAATSLVALLASVVPLASPTSASSLYSEGVTPRERILDQWLDERIEPTKGKLVDLKNKNALLSNRIRLIDRPIPASGNIEDTGHLANLGLISAVPPRLLAQLLARLGGLLTDDVEGTRLLACTGLTLLFGGIFSGGSEDAIGEEGANCIDGKYIPGAFLRSPAWFLPLLEDDLKGIGEVDIDGHGDKMPGLTAPLPNSLGDKVYRFYPNLLKALDDASDDVRLRAADAFVTWFWVMSPNLIDSPLHVAPLQASQETTPNLKLNPVYSAVVDDLTSTVAVHLDDGESVIRAAAARVMLRIAQIAPDSVRRVLSGARERHRSPQLCEALLSSLEWRCEDGKI